MNSIIVTIALLVITTLYYPIQCADTQHNQKKLSATEQLFRHIVLSEPHAEHPSPYAWHIDDTKTVAAIACVDKEWNTLHKHYIAQPREDCEAQHKGTLKISKPTMLFNKFGQFCCLGVYEHEYKLSNGSLPLKCIFGGQHNTPDGKHEFQIYGVTDVFFPSNQTLPLRISSAEITYYDTYKHKKTSPLFHITTLDNEDYLYLIMPEEQQKYRIYIEQNRIPIEYKRPSVIKFRKTVSKILQATFDLSQQPDFWRYVFSNNAVYVQRDLSNALITIQPTHTYFQEAYHTIATLNTIKKSFEEDTCSCGTNHIDPDCRRKYTMVCDLLTNEYAQHLKKDFLQPFVEKHIRHTIGHIQTKNGTDTIYINPYGILYRYTHCSDTFRYHEIKGYKNDILLPFDIESLQTAASMHALRWHTVGNLIFSENFDVDKKYIKCLVYQKQYNNYYCDFLKINADEHIVDGTIIECHGTFPFIIAVVQQGLTSSYRINFHNDSHAWHPLTYCVDSEHALRKGFAQLLWRSVRKPNTYSCTVAAPKKEITAFMHFIKGIKNSIINIHDIFPSSGYTLDANPFD